MVDIYSKVIGLVRANLAAESDSHIQFSNPDYTPFNLNKSYFNEIKKDETGAKIAFIDGGSSEIIKSSNLSLNLIRSYYAIFQNAKRISAKKHDFYAFVSAKNIDNELFYNVEFINNEDDRDGLDKNDFLLSSLDETIRQGIARASISNMPNVIRRFSEIKTALDVIGLLDKGDIIVLDGSLQCTFTNEKKYFEELYKKAAEKGVIICGLSKTTTLMTDKGNSIANALNKFNVSGRWLYYPVAEIKSNEHKAEMCFVKMHEKSRHVFRFEIYKEQKEKLMKTISLLADNCNDPVFLGYPYGLVDADKNARISNQEKEMFLTLFSAKFGKDWEKVRESLSNVDAHEILDKIG